MSSAIAIDAIKAQLVTLEKERDKLVDDLCRRDNEHANYLAAYDRQRQAAVLKINGLTDDITGLRDTLDLIQSEGTPRDIPQRPQTHEPARMAEVGH